MRQREEIEKENSRKIGYQAGIPLILEVLLDIRAQEGKIIEAINNLERTINNLKN